VWEASTGIEFARMTHNGVVNSIAFSPNGKYVVSGSDDGTARVWIYRPEDLIAEACSRVTRNLTRTEWKLYIGDALPYQAVCPNLPIEAEFMSAP
jgi:WD40 repeat protein